MGPAQDIQSVIPDLQQKSELVTEPATNYESVSGIKMRVVRFRIWVHVIKQIFRITKNLTKLFQFYKKLFNIRKVGMGNIRLRNYVKFQNQYYWSIYAPPWPSRQLDTFIKNEADVFIGRRTNPLQFIFLSITKKCPLQCQHCFEWDIMHKDEKLSLSNLKSIVRQFINQGINSVILTGGEPLSRYKDLLELVEFSAKECQVWMFTSGYGLTKERCKELKRAGLTGVIVSIDHFQERIHNQFRGNENSFQKAVSGVRHANSIGLLTALSLCVTKNFVNGRNLDSYMELANKLGVAFVQFMEPQLLGKFKETGHELNKIQIDILERFFQAFNGNPSKANYPTIIYQGYHQRRIGCHGAGKRYLYVDSNGSVNACPFCPKKIGTAANGPVSYSSIQCQHFSRRAN